MSITLIRKTENADRSPYAVMAENDRHKNLKGLCLILRNFGRGSACLLAWKISDFIKKIKIFLLNIFRWTHK